MKYPTREQAEKIVYCLNGDCEACSVREWCEGEETTNCGKAMLAMHDALDAKQAELDTLNKVKTELCDKYLERLEELDKAHDLIRRLTAWAHEDINIEVWDDVMGVEELKKINRLLDEADVMTKGEA